MNKLKIFIFFIFFLLRSFSSFAEEESKKVSIYFFWGQGCPHCEKEKIFLDKLTNKYSFIEIKEFEVWSNDENIIILENISKELNFNASSLPITIVGKKYFIGFLNEETTGKDIENEVINFYENGSTDVVKNHIKKTQTIPETIKIPFFGVIKLKNLSLPLLTILLGAIDGFNPCAMWVLLMLISFLMVIPQRKKMIILGSIFIITSAFVYFLFMVAWLNFLFFLKYVPWIKIVIGTIAVMGGGYYLKEFYTNKEGICKVTGSKQKKLISEKLASMLKKKKFWLAVISIIILAFFVNLIELICSAGLPAVYTQVLSLTPLSNAQYYLYILLYVLIFMLDDLVIFLIAVFSLQLVNMTNKYSHYSHLIGGIILVIIGAFLIFKPELLMF